jgi:hypothetical protein
MMLTNLYVENTYPTVYDIASRNKINELVGAVNALEQLVTPLLDSSGPEEPVQPQEPTKACYVVCRRHTVHFEDGSGTSVVYYVGHVYPSGRIIETQFQEGARRFTKTGAEELVEKSRLEIHQVDSD